MQDCVGAVVVAGGQVEHLVSFERVVPVHGPLEHGVNLHALELLRDLLRGDLNLHELRAEDSHALERALEATEADAAGNRLSVAYPYHPLIGLTCHALFHNELIGPHGEELQVVASE